MKYFPNATSAYQTAYTAAAAMWTTGTDITLTKVASINDARFFGVAADYGASGWDGYTTWGCNALLQFSTVTMSLNKYYMDSFPAAKKKIVAAHEIGHGVGLAHSTASGYPIMASSAANSYNHGTTGLTSDDKASMNAKY